MKHCVCSVSGRLDTPVGGVLCDVGPAAHLGHVSRGHQAAVGSFARGGGPGGAEVVEFVEFAQFWSVDTEPSKCIL